MTIWILSGLGLAAFLAYACWAAKDLRRMRERARELDESIEILEKALEAWEVEHDKVWGDRA